MHVEIVLRSEKKMKTNRMKENNLTKMTNVAKEDGFDKEENGCGKIPLPPSMLHKEAIGEDYPITIRYADYELHI